MGVGRVADHGGAVFAGSLGNEEVGAGLHASAAYEAQGAQGEEEFSESLFHQYKNLSY